jgi:hypothetical protein
MPNFLIGGEDVAVMDAGVETPVAFIRASAVARFRGTLEQLEARGFRLRRCSEIGHSAVVGNADSLPPAPGETEPC